MPSVPHTRRSVLAALPSMAGLPALAPSVGLAKDPLGVRADFPVAETSLYLNSAYITPTPLSFLTQNVDEIHWARPSSSTRASSASSRHNR